MTPKATPPGTSLALLSGTITNPAGAPSDVLVNDLQFALSGASATFLTPDTNSFFANVPGVFAPGDSYTGIVFGLQLASNTPLGSYSGTVTLLGDPNGADPGATQSLATTTFQLAVAPEPATGLLGITALPFAAMIARRRNVV
jgi:hypothetical protein